MKKCAIFCLMIAFAASAVNAQERGPVTVSPGSDTGIARVGTNCPTFSWTATEWATGYSVVVFETNGPNVLVYKEMAAISSPVLSKEIQGRALSWTPSSEERLRNGGMYVWYVAAVGGYGQGTWSEGRMFKVEAEVQLAGMEDTVRDSLREKGISEEAIEDVLEDLRLGTKEVMAFGIDIEGIEEGEQDKVIIQGTEGTDNTFYGLDAGASTTGLSNSFFGRSAGYANTTGFSNTFMGYGAGYSNSTGFSNTFMGYYAGYKNTTGHHNTIIGNYAGFYNTTGSSNVFLGTDAGQSETGSSKLYIDNSNTSAPLIWGDFVSKILTVHGKLGIGTKSPAYKMEMQTTGTNAAFVAQRTDGATNYINATAGFGNFGTVTNHPLRLAVNSVWRMRLDSDNSLTMANGAMCTAGGTWQNYSKREAKENIHDLTAPEAMDTLKGLVAVKYNYKVDKEEKHVGFIAEDVPDLVASKDRNGISAMDIVAVLTKVVQEQQEMIKKQQNVAKEQQKQDSEQQEIIDKLQERIAELQKQIDELKGREK